MTYDELKKKERGQCMETVWHKRDGMLALLIALTSIFFFLVFYHYAGSLWIMCGFMAFAFLLTGAFFLSVSVGDFYLGFQHHRKAKRIRSLLVACRLAGGTLP